MRRGDSNFKTKRRSERAIKSSHMAGARLRLAAKGMPHRKASESQKRGMVGLRIKNSKVTARELYQGLGRESSQIIHYGVNEGSRLRDGYFSFTPVNQPNLTIIIGLSALKAKMKRFR